MAKAKKAEATAAPEGYTVLARRYRPQTFADLVGQEAVARALVNALQSNRVAHAYLFTGARGVGKTSTARILAKALNCEQGPTATPCLKCASCQAIATGEDVDVLEIDGASNRRIDEIREIRGNVQYRPGRARFKIYIIDEVHMLTKEAFNALLKTLEEPPPHVKFIFATTEVEKIPVTILSRCQRFDFGGISLPLLVERLRLVVKGENKEADDEALELVARRAGGSLRDAQSLLDQLLAFGGDRLTVEQVHQMLGTAADDRILALAEGILSGDPKRALDLLDEAATSGLQLGELVEQLIAYWRDLMVLRAGGSGRDLSVPARHKETLARQAHALSLDAILAGLDVLSATKARLRGSSHGRTLVEMALVRLGRLKDLVSLSQLSQWLTLPRADGAGPAPARVAPPEGVKKKPLTGSLESEAGGAAELTQDTLPRIWERVLNGVGSMLASEMKKAGDPAIFGPNTLVLRFPSVYNRACEYCQDPARLARMEEALRKVAGRSWTLRVEAPSTVEPAATAAGEAGPAMPVRPRRDHRGEAEKLPLVKRAMDVLGAKILQVEEGFGASDDEAPRRADAVSEEER